MGIVAPLTTTASALAQSPPAHTAIEWSLGGPVTKLQGLKNQLR